MTDRESARMLQQLASVLIDEDAEMCLEAAKAYEGEENLTVFEQWEEIYKKMRYGLGWLDPVNAGTAIWEVIEFLLDNPGTLELAQQVVSLEEAHGSGR